jgi:hypothetical protein
MDRIRVEVIHGTILLESIIPRGPNYLTYGPPQSVFVRRFEGTEYAEVHGGVYVHLPEVGAEFNVLQSVRDVKAFLDSFLGVENQIIDQGFCVRWKGHQGQPRETILDFDDDCLYREILDSAEEGEIKLQVHCVPRSLLD